jgi:hypothetical protein
MALTNPAQHTYSVFFQLQVERRISIQYPDFMVTKTFPMPLGSPRRKHILTIIEIKVDSKDVEAVSEDPPRSILAGAQTQLER